MNCPKCKSTRRRILSYELVREKKVMMIKNKWECQKCTHRFYVSIPDEQPTAVTI